ncbi:cuticle protein 7-like [Penaeus japonicus]|uniref:cuticle protein 7-like n=1 Tax=Penaeus japonicus TaxID=27405 RepID=UPI001C7104EC|nr:cuticle protein 7-like [Penaeus japonicus]
MSVKFLIPSSLLQLFLLLGALAALASAVPRPDNPPVYGAPPPTYKQPGMPFDFAYAVRDDYSGNDYAHQQTSDGHVTSGSYYVVLPDGRTEMVSFEADHDNGFVANVAYEGEARYPAPAPSYHPPPPSYHPPAPSYHAPAPSYPPPPPHPHK